MATSTLYAKRSNNGQSEIWLKHDPTTLRVVATNAIVFPIRTICTQDESEAFHREFYEGAAIIPQAVENKLMIDFKF